MKHHGIDRWTDFSRGLPTDLIRTEMHQHPATGCHKCRGLAKFSNKLTVTSALMTARTVPESIVGMARAIFPVRMQNRTRRGKAPIVSGAAALLRDVNSKTDDSSAAAAMARAVPVGQELGAGELDLNQAVLAATKK